MNTSHATHPISVAASSGSDASRNQPAHGPAIFSEPGFALERPTPQMGRHVTRENVWSLPATREKVFPLLCPVLEYDWIAGWHARLIHAPSGAAEDNCIFETRIAPFGSMIWVCTRYEPVSYIEYTSFSERGLVIRLKIHLEADGDHMRIRWVRSWYATNSTGEAFVRDWSDAHYNAMMEHHRAEMLHYLNTGTLLQPGQPK